MHVSIGVKSLMDIPIHILNGGIEGGMTDVVSYRQLLLVNSLLSTVV